MNKSTINYRKRKSVDEWRDLIGKLEKSDVTKTHFAEVNDITVEQINHLMKRFTKEKSNFIPVSSAAFVSDPVRICLPTGVKIECTSSSDISYVKRLIEELL